MFIKACASFVVVSVLVVYAESSYAGNGLRKVHSKEYEKAQKKRRDQARDLKYEANFPATVAPSAIEVADAEAERVLDRIRHPEKYESWDDDDAAYDYDYEYDYEEEDTLSEQASDEQDQKPYIPSEEFYSGIAFDRLNAYRDKMDALTSESRIVVACIERLKTLGRRVERNGWTLERARTLSGCIKQMQEFDRDFKSLSRGYQRLKRFLNRYSHYLVREVQVERLSHQDFLAFKEIRKIWSRTRRYKKQMQVLGPQALEVLAADRAHLQKLQEVRDTQILLNLSSETIFQFKSDRGSLNESE